MTALDAFECKGNDKTLNIKKYWEDSASRFVMHRMSCILIFLVSYQPDETIRLEVRMENETVWLTQQQMAELFHRDQSVIARHISNVFKEKELIKEGNMQILHNTLSKYKPTSLYSLDVIISVGYRVKSQQGTDFRKWANKVLKDFLLRGYPVNQRFEQWSDGASIKDLGKKWFAFSLLHDITTTELINKIVGNLEKKT